MRHPVDADVAAVPETLARLQTPAVMHAYVLIRVEIDESSVIELGVERLPGLESQSAG